MTAQKRVLVIDDSLTVHKAIAQALCPDGFEIVSAYDGPTGIQKAKTDPPDLVLLDFEMPDFNGYQTCKVLSECEATKGIPVVLMSSRGAMVGEKLLHSTGIVDYISKPFSPEALLTVTRHVLNNHRHPLVQQKDPAHLPFEEIGKQKFDSFSVSEDQGVFPGKIALRGLIGMIPAAEVFQLLQLQSQTGMLHLVRNTNQLEVFLLNGTIAFAKARNVPEEFLLGRYLVESQAITAQELELFLKSRKGSNKLLGEQLVKLGYITMDQLNQALENQSAALIYETLRWEEGEFFFYATHELPSQAHRAKLGLSINQILMEGFRRIDEWGIIEQEIDHFDMVVARNSPETNQASPIVLQVDEQQLLDLIDGQRSVRMLVKESRRSSFYVCKILYRLLACRLIRKLPPIPSYRETKQ